MRLFIHHGADGNIISVSKAEIMDPSLEHPYAEVAPGEGVLEVKPTSELQALDCHEIAEHYLVDLKKMKLKKKTSRA